MSSVSVTMYLFYSLSFVVYSLTFDSRIERNREMKRNPLFSFFFSQQQFVTNLIYLYQISRAKIFPSVFTKPQLGQTGDDDGVECR